MKIYFVFRIRGVVFCESLDKTIESMPSVDLGNTNQIKFIGSVIKLLFNLNIIEIDPV